MLSSNPSQSQRRWRSNSEETEAGSGFKSPLISLGENFKNLNSSSFRPRADLFFSVRNAAQPGWKIAAGTQEINDDRFVFSLQKHRKMLSGASEKQIFVDSIDQRCATLAAGHAAGNSFAVLI